MKVRSDGSELWAHFLQPEVCDKSGSEGGDDERDEGEVASAESCFSSLWPGESIEPG